MGPIASCSIEWMFDQIDPAWAIQCPWMLNFACRIDVSSYSYNMSLEIGNLSSSLVFWLAALAGGCFYAEFSGYFVHRLLHSEKIPFLSKNHMIHHLRIYGPKMKQRPSVAYLSAVENRAAVAGVGLEWILPGLSTGGIAILGLWIAGASGHFIAAFLVAGYGWSFLMFGYVHDTMHRKDFAVENSRFIGKWYRSARRKHDIHHCHLDNNGRMTDNFGICFFLFDRIFGTYRNRQPAFNSNGYDAALKKYSFVFDAPGQV